MTVGIAASHASTAFGYVRSGQSLDLAGAPTALHAVGFTEKPDVATATAYLATGEYRWNAGMFLVRAGSCSTTSPTSAPPCTPGCERSPRPGTRPTGTPSSQRSGRG